jgi:hypothetical protein
MSLESKRLYSEKEVFEILQLHNGYSFFRQRSFLEKEGENPVIKERLDDLRKEIIEGMKKYRSIFGDALFALEHPEYVKDSV